MSNVCCKEFVGWCKSFTKTEILLCVLQAIFFVVFLAFLTFLILHLVVCSRNKQEYVGVQPSWNESTVTSTDSTTPAESAPPVSTEEFETDINRNRLKVPTTLHKEVKCTWIPSHKTEALTHYYDNNTYTMTTKLDQTMITNQDQLTTEANIKGVNKDTHWDQIDIEQESEFEDELLEDLSDGKEVHDFRKVFLLALVKIKPPQDITFGCTLTIVNEFWTLTAASCIEAIEEVDSLDSFVMMQGFKDQHQNIYPVADVMIHPQYQGVNVTFDLAALKSEVRLVEKGTSVVTLPTLLDYFVITIGEALTLLGYGKFRSIDKDPLGRSVREVRVHTVPPAQCAGGTWAPRHLAGGTRERHAACGAAPLCAGPLRARPPCGYCAGTPLLRGAALLGVMGAVGAGAQCGLACEPAPFASVARAAAWLRALRDQ